MKTVEKHGSFEDVIRESSDDVKELTRLTRDLIAEIYPELVMVPWPQQKTIGFGVGPKKMSEHFSYIGVFGKHINLGFNYGADLPDPDNVLEGTGKKFRKLKISTKKDLERPVIRKLIEAAVKEREITIS